ncbi:MAG TPA: GIY-YIG nuclease family protein [Puia sp.]|nr:GIY-YIG nuclease family protein [Puia sp.]
MSFKMYILYSAKIDRYYIGSCEDINIRILQHNSGRNKSTKSGVPWEIKYIEEFQSRAEAQSREIQIKKKKSRKYIEWLISSVG